MEPRPRYPAEDGSQARLMASLENTELEERILGMMLHGAKVQSLTGNEFSSFERKTIYLLIRSGNIAAINHQNYYIGDLRKLPEIPKAEIRGAVEELKRLYAARLVEAELASLLARLHKVDMDTLNGLKSVLARVRETNP